MNPDGEKFKRYRIMMGMTQDELCKEALVGKRTVQKVEYGEPDVTFPKLEAIARVICLPLNEIFIFPNPDDASVCSSSGPEASNSITWKCPDGKKFKRQRKIKGMTQEDVCLLADVGVRTVQNVEYGDPRVMLSNVEAIAQVIDLELDEIHLPNPWDADREKSDSWKQEDGFFDIPWKLFEHVQKRFVPGALAYCENRREVESVIKRMRKSWAQHLKISGAHDLDCLFGNADQQLNQRYDDYLRRYLRIWNFLPETLLCSTTGKKKTGVNIVLPVTDAAYEKLKTGEISFMDITYKDVVAGSQNLVYDSTVEFDNAPRRAWYEVTSSLSVVASYQTVSLVGNPTLKNFRVLSFGASPVNIERLQSVGFAANGVRMPDFEFPIYEFRADNSDLTEPSDEIEGTRTATVDSAGLLKGWFKKRHLSHKKLIRKRRLALSALKAYWNILPEVRASRQRPAA